MKKNWGKFMIFTLVVGLIVGYVSTVSDNLPYLGDGVTFTEFIISYVAVMVNSLPVWFMLAMLAGYLFAGNKKEAALFGGIYTIAAITFYFLLGNLNGETAVEIPLKEQLGVFAFWYGASAVGGILGGGAGFLLKKTPMILLALLAGLILQLIVNGTNSWNDIVGIAQNITFSLLALSIIIYLAMKQRDGSRASFSERG
ncbi:hypothetical protein [Bacillus sp. REN3]|uniref:hypothetical protein n=1 Tax=Bacillus sp. REN3 TaxID=2802440 RepID=UPI001FEF8D1C|nr:hypothetical protein [Bacillus sp. REN3]